MCAKPLSSLWNVFQDWQVNLTRETLMSSGKKWYSSSVWASLRMYRDNKVLGIYNTLWQKCFLGHKNRAATGVIFYPLRQGERDSHKVTYLLELTRSYFTRQEVVLESNHCSSALRCFGTTGDTQWMGIQLTLTDSWQDLRPHFSTQKVLFSRTKKRHFNIIVLKHVVCTLALAGKFKWWSENLGSVIKRCVYDVRS